MVSSYSEHARRADFSRCPKSCFSFSVSRSCDMERVQLEDLRLYSKTELKNSLFEPISDRVKFSIDFINKTK